jgi:diphthamide biosynthesis protein 3
MSLYYDEVEIEDMTWQADTRTWYYACPCGDLFFFPLADALAGEDVARCPSCSLLLRVVFDIDALEARFAAGEPPAAAGGAGAVAVGSS